MKLGQIGQLEQPINQPQQKLVSTRRAGEATLFVVASVEGKEFDIAYRTGEANDFLK